jgi:hypothetical protein
MQQQGGADSDCRAINLGHNEFGAVHQGMHEMPNIKWQRALLSIKNGKVVASCELSRASGEMGWMNLVSASHSSRS